MNLSPVLEKCSQNTSAKVEGNAAASFRNEDARFLYLKGGGR